MKYSNGFRARMIARMAGPERVSATRLAEEVGVTQTTLSRWLREASGEEKRKRRKVHRREEKREEKKEEKKDQRREERTYSVVENFGTQK